MKNENNTLFKKQVKKIFQNDLVMYDFYKEKYEHSLKIIEYIKNQKAPFHLEKDYLTLFALYDYFQKEYVLKRCFIYDDVICKISGKIPWKTINIVSKTSNFPHLIGAQVVENDTNIKITHQNKVKMFLDGVLYHWILLYSNKYYILDFSKVEVFSWITQTLSNPTYILTKSAVRPQGTKICGDLFFCKKIFNSDKYCFHLVVLKHQDENNFAFVSQFAIEKNRFYRIKKMFDLSQAIYKYKKPR